MESVVHIFLTTELFQTINVFTLQYKIFFSDFFEVLIKLSSMKEVTEEERMY